MDNLYFQAMTTQRCGLRTLRIRSQKNNHMPVFDCKRRVWSHCQGDDKFCHLHWFLIQAQTVLFSICLRHTHTRLLSASKESPSTLKWNRNWPSEHQSNCKTHHLHVEGKCQDVWRSGLNGGSGTLSPRRLVSEPNFTDLFPNTPRTFSTWS